MGLGKLINKSLTHTDLHKPNNRLVSVQLKHFGARTNHKQTRTHKTHNGPDLGEATTFPFIIYFVPDHETSTQMSFCPQTPKFGSPEISKVESPATLRAHNFVCKPPIEMRSKERLQPSSGSFQQFVASHLYTKKSGRFLTFNGWESNCQFDSQPFFWP